MKTYIKAITVIFVLTLLSAGPISPLIAQDTAAEVTNVIAEARDSHPSDIDALAQLSSVLSAQTHRHGGGKVLVIPTSQIQPQDMVNLLEDMTVMCNIFDKKLAQSNLISGMSYIGVTLPGRFFLGSDSIGAMYVQGYGALFMTTVDFPLSPPPETEEKEDAKEEDADPVWEQMKQEIFSPEQAPRHTTGHKEVKYDAEKVENLKNTLKKALVHATNIRGLEPDESVVITVTGSGGDGSSNIGKVVAINGTNQITLHYKDKNTTKILKSPSLNDLDASLPTILTIHAKKSYIDALAQQKIDYDEFEEKIQLISYPSLDYNTGGRLSPLFLQTGTIDYSAPASASVGVSEGRRSDRRRSRGSGTNVVLPSGRDRGDRR